MVPSRLWYVLIVFMWAKPIEKPPQVVKQAAAKLAIIISLHGHITNIIINVNPCRRLG